MPAAAKIEKPAASGEITTNGKGKTGTNTNGAAHVTSTSMLQDPVKIANTIVEKKIRNLEKRKVRLLEIKALEDKGQQLEADQKNAVKKLDNVSEMVDMLKEIGKNVTDGLTEHAKQFKKQQKKEQLEKQTERQQQDLARVKLMLNVQFILSRFSAAKNDFLQGENGAIKLGENQIDSLEKLFAELCPKTFDLIEQSAEKINYLLEGHKREFVSGISYSDLKEMITQLVESSYFQNLPSSESVVDSSSSDNIEEENSAEENDVPVVETVQNNSEAENEEQVERKQPVQNNVHQLPNQLCFMRDPVVENELQHKDPAVVAVASSGFPFPPQIAQGLSTSSGSNIVTSNSISNHYSQQLYTPVSIPTQTFTNPNYSAIMPQTNFIPVSLSGQIPTMIPDHHIPIRNPVGPDSSTIVQNDSQVELTSEKAEQFVSEPVQQKDTLNLQTSQDAEGKPATNGQAENHFKRNNHRGGRGGNSRGNFNPNYRGRGKNFGTYFNNGANNNGHATNSQNGNYNPRPINRQNGNGQQNRSAFRQDRVVPRNQANYNQPAPVSAK